MGQAFGIVVKLKVEMSAARIGWVQILALALDSADARPGSSR